MLQEILFRYKNREGELGVQRAVVRQQRILKKLCAERSRMERSNKYTYVLCRPAATHYMNRKLMNRAKCMNEMAGLIREAERMQAQHIVQILNSQGLPDQLIEVLAAHLNELQAVYDNTRTPTYRDIAEKSREPIANRTLSKSTKKLTVAISKPPRQKPTKQSIENEF